MSKITKIIIIVFLVLVLGFGGVYFFNKQSNSSLANANSQAESTSVTEYEDLLTQVMERKDASDVVFNNAESGSESIALGKVLRVGIRTHAGVVKVSDRSSHTLPDSTVQVDDKNTTITSVMPVQLVRAFLLDGKQILMFAVSSGDNNCDIQYQIMTVSDSNYKVTKPFGTCLPFTSIAESDDSLTVTMPQSDPYLGDNVSYTYLYKNEKVKLLSKPTQKQLKNMYSNYTAKLIIDIAKKDGCYQDGVMLDNTACGDTKRYCSMFKNLNSKVKHDSNYMILKDFCS